MTTNLASDHHVILVGVDGSEGSDRALAWAAREAELRGDRLRIVHAVSLLTPMETGWLARSGVLVDDVLADAEEAGQRLVKEASETVHAGHPDVAVDTVVARSDARSMLLAAGREADMVVVGSRGHGPIRSLLLGSVGVTLVRHSEVPVAVVRNRGDASRRGVLVGTSGTRASIPALHLAFHEAQLRNEPVMIVNCMWDGEVGSVQWVDMTDADPRHRERLAAVRRVVAEVGAEHPDVDVDVRLVRGAADRCLVDIAETAEVVIVGRHGTSPLDYAGLGTVSTPVVEHADSVVLVVPHVATHAR